MDAETRAQIEAKALVQEWRRGVPEGRLYLGDADDRLRELITTALLAAAQEVERLRKGMTFDCQAQGCREPLNHQEMDRLEAEVARLTQREVELLAVLRVAKDALDSVGVTLRELALRREA